jgi:hypothetical protein
MSDYRNLIDERTGRGATFKLFNVTRKTYDIGSTSSSQYLGRQLQIELKGGAILLEPGALQYSLGHLSAEVQKKRGGRLFASRRRASGNRRIGVCDQIFRDRAGLDGTNAQTFHHR